LDEACVIDGYPSARILFECRGEKGELHLSSIYESYNSRIPSFVSEGDILTTFCPWCNASLMSNRKCDKCNAQMVVMNIENGGKIQICSRKGCGKHFLEFEDLDGELKAFYNVYSTFFKG
jgi:methionyl-tRNA synthetase